MAENLRTSSYSNGDPDNWGYIGDLSLWNEKLVEILN
jgi:hypothetical protein